MKALFAQFKGGRKDLVLVCGMIGILVILFTPIPPTLLDFLLITNLTLALLILLLTFYTEKPLSFSTFPSLLLITTLFRLALNISATRLILDGGYAGHVINAIGSYVVAGNYVIGLVVFLILVVVQYVVVTNGAQRVAEVAARFTLDSMPGKQMAIDADMNMGIIDEHEAKKRRQNIEKEGNFYGAMDGATKFVKGDAIAGIIIILIDIVGGLSVGIVQHGMSWSQALHDYTLLTVGDGIVTQIPSLVIATATGIIITRAASDAQLGEEISRQITSQPRTLLIVAGALLCILMLPGLPALPVLAMLLLLGAIIFWSLRAKSAAAVEEPAARETETQDPQDFYQLMRIDPIEVRLGRALAEPLFGDGSGLTERLQSLRKQFALDFGFVMSPIRVRQDARLPANRYAVDFFGSQMAGGELRADKLLAINPGGKRAGLEGEKAQEPTYGLPALWIDLDKRQFARSAGYTLVDPETVLVTHFSEVVKRNAAELLTRAEAERLVGRVADQQGSLIEELVPNVLSYSDIQKVLQQLLREQVSIRNIEAILEVLVDQGKATKVAEELTEKVRERLGANICQSVADGRGEVQVLTLAPDLERKFLGATRDIDKTGGRLLALEPRRFEQFLLALGKQCEAMLASNLLPVLLCPGPVRRYLRQLVGHALPHMTVLGLNEVPPGARIKSFAVVALPEGT